MTRSVVSGIGSRSAMKSVNRCFHKGPVAEKPAKDVCASWARTRDGGRLDVAPGVIEGNRELTVMERVMGAPTVCDLHSTWTSDAMPVGANASQQRMAARVIEMMMDKDFRDMEGNRNVTG